VNLKHFGDAAPCVSHHRLNIVRFKFDTKFAVFAWLQLAISGDLDADRIDVIRDRAGDAIATDYQCIARRERYINRHFARDATSASVLRAGRSQIAARQTWSQPSLVPPSDRRVAPMRRRQDFSRARPVHRPSRLWRCPRPALQAGLGRVDACLSGYAYVINARIAQACQAHIAGSGTHVVT
jgi:hypothetical protein